MSRAVLAVLFLSVAVAPSLRGQAANRLKDPFPGRSTTLAARAVAPPTINIRYATQRGGTQVSIGFNPVPSATTYTLRRGLSSTGPFIALSSMDFSLQTIACCEIVDLTAYRTGPSHPVWYVVDAWAGPTLLLSSSAIQYDLPPFFKGPLRVDMARTGTNEWTVGWEPDAGVTGYNVSVTLNGGTVVFRNLSLPAGQNQIKLNGLQTGSEYRVEVAATIPWNGALEAHRGTTSYTAP